MKLTEGKNLVIIVLAVLAVIAVGFFAPLQETRGVHIFSNVVISQGAAGNDTQNESVKVQGIFVNDGDLLAEDLIVTIIFTDDAHDKVVRKIVKEGVDLLPNKGLTVEFESEYLRERTEPKTDVKVTVQLGWIENGELKTLTTAC